MLKPVTVDEAIADFRVSVRAHCEQAGIPFVSVLPMMPVFERDIRNRAVQIEFVGVDGSKAYGVDPA